MPQYYDYLDPVTLQNRTTSLFASDDQQLPMRELREPMWQAITDMYHERLRKKT